MRLGLCDVPDVAHRDEEQAVDQFDLTHEVVRQEEAHDKRKSSYAEPDVVEETHSLVASLPIFKVAVGLVE